MSDSTPRRLLIIWWSRTGASRQLALACRAGAASAAAPVQVRCLRCDRVGIADLLQADAYVFVAPENLGSLAGMMKAFFDRLYYDGLDQLAGRAYAALITAGSDGEGAQRQLERIVTGWRLRQAAATRIVRLAAQTPQAILAPKQVPAQERLAARELGLALAEGLSQGIF